MYQGLFQQFLSKPVKTSLRVVGLLAPVTEWETLGSERLRNLPKNPQQESQTLGTTQSSSRPVILSTTLQFLQDPALVFT